MKHANLLLLGIASLTLLSGCERGAGTLSVTGGDPSPICVNRANGCRYATSPSPIRA